MMRSAVAACAAVCSLLAGYLHAFETLFHRVRCYLCVSFSFVASLLVIYMFLFAGFLHFRLELLLVTCFQFFHRSRC